MATTGVKEYKIVILGGNMGGVNVAHYLFRHTIPALKKLDSSKEFEIVMVSPSTHFYWKLGAPRALVNKELIPLDTIFKPIKDGLSSYPSGKFSLVQGLATLLSPSQRTVTVKKSGGSTEAVTFDSLIICTGTTSNSPLWTLQGDHTLSQEAHNKLHADLPNAKTILVAGGGAVGVETTGEIADAYPNAKVTLLSGSKGLLERAPVSGTGKRAEERLKALSVEIVHNMRVKSRVDAADKKVQLTMDNGSNRTVDLYIDATGGKPNTDYVPSEWLNEHKRVKVDADTMRVKEASNVYALGDCADYTNQTYMYTDAAVAPVCSSLGVDVAKSLQSQTPKASSGLFGWLLGSGSALTQKTFQPLKGTIIIPIGRKSGIGSIMGFLAPSIMIHMIKGKTYFTEQVPKTMNGELRAKA